MTRSITILLPFEVSRSPEPHFLVEAHFGQLLRFSILKPDWTFLIPAKVKQFWSPILQ